MADQETTILGESIDNEGGEQTTAQDSPLEQLVGDGKKYKTVEELAKAYVNADQHITTLKGEKTTLESEFNAFKTKAQTIEDVLSRLESQTQQTVTQKEQHTTQTPVVNSETIAQTLRELLPQINSEQEVVSKQKANVKESWDKLATLYGDAEKAKKAVMNYIGGDTGKKALIEQMGKSDPAGLAVYMERMKKPDEVLSQDDSKLVSGEYDSAQLTWAAAKQLKKDNPKEYFSPRFQAKLHKAAGENPKFYGG